MNPLPMVLADLRALRFGGVVAVLLVGLAVAIGIAVGAQERALRKASARAADDFPLLVGAPGSPTQMVLTGVYLQAEALPLIDGAVMARLAADPRVAGAAPLAYGDIVSGYPVVGTSAAFATRFGRIAPAEGRVFAAAGEAVVGADVRFGLGSSLTPAHATAGHRHVPGESDAEEASHRHEAVRLTVVGRLPRLGSPWDRAILVPVETVWATHGLGDGHAAAADGTKAARIGPPWDAAAVPGVPIVVVKPKAVFDAYRLRSEYRQGGTMAVFPAEVLVSLYGTVGDLRDILVLVAALDDAVVFLAILLLTVTLVGARRRRYAVLRALGAGRVYVAAVVWLGAAALTTAGSLLGLGLGWFAATALSWAIAARTGLALSATIGAGEIGFAAAMAGLGSLFAILPALAATRQPVVEALRS